MFRILGETGTECTGITRRSFVQAGLLGLGGLAWRISFACKRRNQPATRGHQRHPGLAQRRTGAHGDLGPQARRAGQYRGPLGAIRTTRARRAFGELLPSQARLMQHLAIVRTVNHGSGDHTKANHWMLTGFEGPAFNAPDFKEQRRPVARLGHVASCAAPIGPACRPMSPSRTCAAAPTTSSTTPLTWAAAPIRSSSSPTRTCRSFASATCACAGADARPPGRSPRSCCEPMDQRAPASRPPHGRPGRALSAGVRHDDQPRRSRRRSTSSREPAGVRDRYGRHTFGQSALLARRLVESGVTFVTVNCVPVGPSRHAAATAKPKSAPALLIPPLDRAIGALIEDLHAARPVRARRWSSRWASSAARRA